VQASNIARSHYSGSRRTPKKGGVHAINPATVLTTTWESSPQPSAGTGQLQLQCGDPTERSRGNDL